MRTHLILAMALAATGCMDANKTTCTYDGVKHDVGDSFPSLDGCNTCSCNGDGQVACTAKACVVTCTYDGQVHQVGDTFPSTDGCNTCTCGDAGAIACTEMACVTTCTYDGETHQVGDTFPATDGCNTCSCGPDGAVGCTKIGCLCDAAAEWWRDYIAKSPAECAAITYSCLAGTTRFANDCGCGCEQAATCEREINCFYPECSNASELASECPYSTIDTSRDCSVESLCPSNAGTFCHRPGQSMGCGMCQNPPIEDTCATDAECQPGSICEPLPCACAGQNVCVPGCAADTECGAAEVCGAAGRCEATPCEPEAACPANFACEGGRCLRLVCTASDGCTGWCVEGACYAEPGNCLAPPP